MENNTDQGEVVTAEAIESAFAMMGSASAPASAIADGLSVLQRTSRTSEDVQRRLGSFDNLRFLTGVVESSDLEHSDLIMSALSCIGNACGLEHEREPSAYINRIGYNWANILLNSSITSETVKLAVAKAVCNITAEYEPSKQACYTARVFHGLLLLHRTELVLSHELFGMLSDSLFGICTQKPNVEPELKDTLPSDVLASIIELPSLYARRDSNELDDYSALVEILLVFLRDTLIQKQIIEENRLGNVWTALQVLQLEINKLDGASEQDAADLQMLTGLSTSLTWCLSDIAALPEFSRTYTLESDAVKHLIRLIIGQSATAGGDIPISNQMLGAAACQILGNLLWALPPGNYEGLVQQDGLHKACFHLIVRAPVDSSSSELVHALVGLLVHLTRPSSAIRELIGADSNCHAALEKLLTHETPAIKQDAVRLIRALGKDCATNQTRFAELAKEALLSVNNADESASGSTDAMGP